MKDIIEKYRKASFLQKSGKFKKSREIFHELLKCKINDYMKANILYHLAQMENTINEKIKTLNRVITLNSDHRMAEILLKLLVKEEVINRLKNDKTGVIKQFFERNPLNVQIQTVSSCNAKCKMCPYHSSWQKSHPGKMSDETFDHIIDLLRDIPIGKICLYLENEPFLDNKLIERIIKVKRNLSYKLIEISTNLSLLTNEKIMEVFKVLRDTPHDFWISWHGIIPEKYKEIMGFDFYKNKEILINYFKITKGKLKTSINSIVGSKLTNKKIITEEDVRNFFFGIIREAGLEPEKINIRIKTFHYHDRAGNIKEEVTNKDVKKLIGKLKPYCSRIKKWLHFMYDGDIILCCMDYRKETVMGNVNQFKSLELLLNSNEFKTMQLKAMGKIKTPDNFICKRCTSPGG